MRISDNTIMTKDLKMVWGRIENIAGKAKIAGSQTYLLKRVSGLPFAFSSPSTLQISWLCLSNGDAVSYKSIHDLRLDTQCI